MRAAARRTAQERAAGYGTFASQHVRRPFPWSVALVGAVAVLVMAILTKAALSGPPISPKDKFMAWCTTEFAIAHCEYSWQPGNWMTVYKAEPHQARRTKLYHDRVEQVPGFPDAAREWLPQARAPVKVPGGLLK
jgi:hypothetical protein